ncbi:hypothetical protein DMA11_22605 [Marinilabiliaceae bacterium JC017]|nr:hypothetical protein DMA11_22605 [Marinilabiliaceae bacterium JC017]
MPEFPHSFSSRLRRPVYLTGLRALDHHGLARNLEIFVILLICKGVSGLMASLQIFVFSLRIPA